MELIDQVCTLEQAKKIKELGIEQLSLCCYMAHGSSFIGNELPSINNFYKADSQSFLWASAFTVAELGIMLPKFTPSYIARDDEFACVTMPFKTGDIITDEELSDACEMTESGISHYEKFKTEAQARAAMLIHKLETGRIKAEEVNNKLAT